LIFAGEGLDSVYQGSLHAALSSGVQAAEEAFDVLHNMKKCVSIPIASSNIL